MRPAFVTHPAYEIDIGNHVFPTNKFRLMKEKLIQDGLVGEEEWLYPEAPKDEDLLLVLEDEYLADLRGYEHTSRTLASELPISESIVEGCARTAAGTILCVEEAMKRGAACHAGGGFHHGFADHAEGFCYINDVAIAAAYARARGLCTRVAIIDTDVHQGNGTARIFSGVRDVFTFSIHQEDIYPKKEESDLDIGLPRSVGDDRYCAELESSITNLLDRFDPELVIYVAGVDPFENDQLGGLGLSFQGLAQREQIVIKPLVDRQIPFVTVVAGGYARLLYQTVSLHVQTVNIALDACENQN